MKRSGEKNHFQSLTQLRKSLLAAIQSRANLTSGQALRGGGGLELICISSSLGDAVLSSAPGLPVKST
jgi:hypothetical protein